MRTFEPYYPNHFKIMITISGNKFIYFDVDDTLIDWSKRNTEDSLVFQDESGGFWSIEPKWNIVRKLKKHKQDGDTIVVWSQGGWNWAREVIKILELEKYVDVVLSKPTTYYDDINCTEFMTDWIKV